MRSPQAVLIAALLHAGPAGAVDIGPAIAHFCDAEWAKKTAPTEAETRQCAELWLRRAYGPRFGDDDLDLDPVAGGTEALAFTRGELRQMQKLVDKVCGRPCTLARNRHLARASEKLRAEADARFSLHDPIRKQSIEPFLQRIFAGEKLQLADFTLDDPTPWSALTLWKLRNAVYARHGLEFRVPDLDTFFFGKRPIKTKADRTRLLPLKKPKPPETRLTATDAANLALVSKLETAARR